MDRRSRSGCSSCRAPNLLVLFNQHALGDPLVGIGVVVFVDPVDEAAIWELDVLGEYVAAEEGVEAPGVRWSAGRGCSAVCGECVEGLGHREGPRRAVPCALIGAGEAKARAATLSSCGSIFAIEALGIEELFPGDRMFGSGRAEVPGVLADELADSGELHWLCRDR